MKYTVIEIDGTKTRPAYVWARETFGKSKGPDGKLTWNEMRWYQRDYHQRIGPTIPRFYFKDSADATMFALRWA